MPRIMSFKDQVASFKELKGQQLEVVDMAA